MGVVDMNMYERETGKRYTIEQWDGCNFLKLKSIFKLDDDDRIGNILVINGLIANVTDYLIRNDLGTVMVVSESFINEYFTF